MTDAPAPKKRGRPRKTKPAPVAMETSALPASLAADPADFIDTDPDIDLVETYFAAFGDKVQVGKGFDNVILNHRLYTKDEAGVEFRFGSFRPGKMERNARGGFIPALIDPKTKQLSPTGKPLIIGPPTVGATSMQLMVRRKEHGDIRREMVKEMCQQHQRNAGLDAAQQAAEELGLKKHFTVDRDEKELVISK